MEACELLAIEDRLDRIEAELAVELPPHLRAFARAHARGQPPPPAPAVLGQSVTLATARAAIVHPVLADRGLALLRLAAPVAIEADPAVAAARAASPTWAGLSALTAARDAAALAWFGRRAIDALHRLHGSAVDLAGLGIAGDAGAVAVADAALPPAVAGWFEPDGIAVDDAGIARAWDELRVRHAVAGAMRYERAAGRARAFVVEPGREVVLAVPAQIVTPAARFAVLHELGHAVAALALPAAIPRVVDEAAAAYIAGGIERAADPWYSPLAGAARVRRRRLAERLDRIERGLPAPPPDPAISERPPWALWHDPGAQAAYAAAERLARAIEHAIEHAIGASPAPGALAAALAAWAGTIDRLGTATSAL